jgi:hypothetical protein
MGYDISIEGELKFCGDPADFKTTPEYLGLLHESDKLSDHILSDLGINDRDELWVIEDFDMEINGSDIKIFGSGRGQYLGVETLLVFMARKGYEGKVSVSGDYSEKFSLENGEVISEWKADGDLRKNPEEITLEKLRENKYFLGN